MIIFLQLASKILTLKYVDLMIGIVGKVVDVYTVNSMTTSRKRALLLQKVSKISEIAIIGGLMLYISSGMLHFINPFFAYYLHNELKVAMPMYLPFIDETTKRGFIILLIIHFVEIIFATVATTCVDFSFLVIIANIPIFSTIFADNVNELSKILREKKTNLSIVKAKLRNIFLLYNDLCQ